MMESATNDCTTDPPMWAHISDEELFKRPPQPDECPICFLVMHNMSEDELRSYQPCCGNFICVGCKGRAFREARGGDACPFCRNSPTGGNFIEDLERRVVAGDPDGMYNLAIEYRDGRCVAMDMEKAVELFHQAAEHGSMRAHAILSDMYRKGSNGLTRNEQKFHHHVVTAAMGGHSNCRHNVALLDLRAGHVDRAMKHYIIAASDGHELSLHALRKSYEVGWVKKEDYAGALRAYQETIESVRSKERDESLNHLRMLKAALAAAFAQAKSKKERDEKKSRRKGGGKERSEGQGESERMGQRKSEH